MSGCRIRCGDLFYRRFGLLDQRIEPVQIHRLHEVMIEADGVALSQVLFHAEAGQRDPENRMIVFNLFHQLDAASIGQTDIAHQDVVSIH